MTDLIVDGRLWITNGTDYLKLACKQIIWNIVVDPEIEHYPANTHIGYDLEYRYLLIIGNDVRIKNYSDYETIISKLLDWQKDNTVIVSIVRNSSNDKIKLDGTYTNCPCLIKKPGLKDLEKISPGDQDKFDIGTMTFEQSGDMT